MVALESRKRLCCELADSGDARRKRTRSKNRLESVIMKPSTQDEIAGNVHEVKGKIKEEVGRVTNNPTLEGEGVGENLAGKVQKKVGQVEKIIEKP
jgi:uncharacterized protein YjbJ (UPF0337 family)